MGGRKYCRLQELSRQVLLDYLIAEGDIAEVDLLEVTVQTMSGRSFEVTLEVGAATSNVWALKAEIETAEGTPWHRQELFELVEDAEDACEEPLADDFLVGKSCAMALCIKAPPAFEWDSDSPLFKASSCEVRDVMCECGNQLLLFRNLICVEPTGRDFFPERRSEHGGQIGVHCIQL
jgi:hypothetical protein